MSAGFGCSSDSSMVSRCGFAPGVVNYKKGAFDSQSHVIKFTSCLPMVGGFSPAVRWFLEDFPLSFIFNTAGFVHSACTSASVVSGATRLDSMYSCPGRYSPLQSLLMFGAEFVPRSVVLINDNYAR
jgi:hypothetical protein